MKGLQEMRAQQEKRARFKGELLLVSGENLLALVELLRDVNITMEDVSYSWYMEGGRRDQIEDLLDLRRGALKS